MKITYWKETEMVCEHFQKTTIADKMRFPKPSGIVRKIATQTGVARE